jgi:hypothetical protein
MHPGCYKYYKEGKEFNNMIKFKNGTYIVGIWYAQKFNLGKVYVYAIQGADPNQWIGHIYYIYNNEKININFDNDNPHHKFLHSNISEKTMMKICQDKIDELHCTFNNEKDKLLINDNYAKLENLKKTKPWLPLIREERRRKVSKYVRKK